MNTTSTNCSRRLKIGIIGGDDCNNGGSVAAVRIASLLRQKQSQQQCIPSPEIVLFENGNDILTGPPFCHNLYAGGMLYTTMSDEEAKMILHHSCWLADWFDGTPGNDCVEIMKHQPTIVTARPDFSCSSAGYLSGRDLVTKCDTIAKWYAEWCKSNDGRQPFGPPETYYSHFSRNDMIKLKKRHIKLKRSNSSSINGGNIFKSNIPKSQSSPSLLTLANNNNAGSSTHNNTKNNNYKNIHSNHLPYIETFADWLEDTDHVQYPTVCMNGVDMNKVKKQLIELFRMYSIRLKCNTVVTDIEQQISCGEQKQGWIVHSKTAPLSIEDEEEKKENDLQKNETTTEYFDFIINVDGSDYRHISDRVVQTMNDIQQAAYFTSFGDVDNNTAASNDDDDDIISSSTIRITSSSSIEIPLETSMTTTRATTASISSSTAVEKKMIFKQRPCLEKKASYNLKIPQTMQQKNERTKFPGIVILGTGTDAKEFGMIQISTDDPPPSPKRNTNNNLNKNTDVDDDCDDTDSSTAGSDDDDHHEYYQINVFAQKHSDLLGNLSLSRDEDDDRDSLFMDPSPPIQGVTDFVQQRRKAIARRMKKWKKKRSMSARNLLAGFRPATTHEEHVQ